MNELKAPLPPLSHTAERHRTAKAPPPFSTKLSMGSIFLVWGCAGYLLRVRSYGWVFESSGGKLLNEMLLSGRRRGSSGHSAEVLTLVWLHDVVVRRVLNPRTYIPQILLGSSRCEGV